MSRNRPKKIVELCIQELSKKGNGKESGCKVEVPFTAPGDLVKVEIQKKNSGKLLEILKPSKDRIAPKCIHFGACGGCRFQHLPYDHQLSFKQGLVEKLLRPFFTDETTLLPIVPAPKIWNYRNKMEFSFSSDKKGEKFLGLILMNSRGKVFHLNECHLVNPWMVEVLKATRKWWEESSLLAYHPPTNTGSLRTLIVREAFQSGDRLVMLTVSGNPEYGLQKKELENFVKTIREKAEPSNPEASLSIFLRIQQLLPGKPTEFYEMQLYGKETLRETLLVAPEQDKETFEVHFGISPSSFFQPNTQQAEKLYSLALQMAKLSGEEVVYDLYCGTCTLGISLSKWARQIIGVELSMEAILDAKENIARNGCENVTLLNGPCQEVLHRIIQENSLPKPDLILLDPPRAGLEKAIYDILALQSKELIYISCNPESQAKDMGLFRENGYRMLKIQPVDQFPHTFHIENIVYLKRN